MSNIADFIGEIHKSSGMAKANRYSIEMALPQTIRSIGTYSEYDFQRMHLFCDSASLPGLNINTTQIRTFGEVREMPYEFNYDPLQFSFYVDGDMIVKGIFDQWIKSIQQGNTRNFNYYKNYISPEMTIWVENMNDDAMYIVKMYEAYPKTVSAVQIGYDQKDIMKVTVSMMYKYWDAEVTSKPLVPQSAYVNRSELNLEGDTQNFTTGTTINRAVNLINGIFNDSTIISNGNPMGDVSGWGDGW
jgi:hypothetical protein